MTQIPNLPWDQASRPKLVRPVNMRPCKQRILDKALSMPTNEDFDRLSATSKTQKNYMGGAAIALLVGSLLLVSGNYWLIAAGAIFGSLYLRAGRAVRNCQGMGHDECKDELAQLVATSPTAALIDQGLRENPRTIRQLDLHHMRIAARLDAAYPD